MIFGIKTRRELKHDVLDLEDRIYRANSKLLAFSDKSNRDDAKIKFYEDIFNHLIFENGSTDIPEGSLLLELKEFSLVGKTEEAIETLEGVKEETETPKYNATLYCSEDAPYMYLSKKLTEGYKYFAANFSKGNIQFYLNNDGKGIEIDSNNRVRNKLILQLLQELYGFIDGKNSLFFEKIQIF